MRVGRWECPTNPIHNRCEGRLMTKILRRLIAYRKRHGTPEAHPHRMVTPARGVRPCAGLSVALSPRAFAKISARIANPATPRAPAGVATILEIALAFGFSRGSKKLGAAFLRKVTRPVH